MFVIVVEIRNLDYKGRLRYLGIQTLETRRLRADMILIYKMLNGIVNVNHSNMFNIVEDIRTRGHSKKLEPVVVPRLDIKKFSFAYRVINHWNALSEEVVTAPTVKRFKTLLHANGNVPDI